MSSQFTYGFKASNYGIRRQGIFRLVISLAVIAWAWFSFRDYGGNYGYVFQYIAMLLPFYALFLVGDTLYRFFRYPAVVNMNAARITVKSFFTARTVTLREDNVEFGLQVRPIMPSFRSYKAVKITRAPGFFGYVYLIGSDRIALRDMLDKIEKP
jgi:hypothetical protein